MTSGPLFEDPARQRFKHTRLDGDSDAEYGSTNWTDNAYT